MESKKESIPGEYIYAQADQKWAYKLYLLMNYVEM
ncbi:hypothetical protein HME7025_02601 [Aquirufa nivalisilvae]|uniref:Uncharacterized protein n=1 Tax=Aquirufa nivalisilvae TaxID=2516557 RepID=A0A2S2DYE6_9BACT|nr:hypothetical protein HME7025_02601 [Aquirufa nivalisilvae]